MSSLNKKARKLISVVKKPRTTKEQLKYFTQTFIELMADSGISPRTRIEFYKFSKDPSINKNKLIDIAENTLLLMEENYKRSKVLYKPSK